MQTKCTLAVTSILMVIIWPASLLLGLLDVVQHTVFEEPPDYRASKSSGGGTSVVHSIEMLGYSRSLLSLRRPEMPAMLYCSCVCHDMDILALAFLYTLVGCSSISGVAKHFDLKL